MTNVPTGHATVKLDAFRLEANMLRLNLAVSCVLVTTSVTRGTDLLGVVKITRGAVVSSGGPKIGSVLPEPPHATRKQDNVVTSIDSLINIFRLEHSRECIPCGGFEKSSKLTSVC